MAEYIEREALITKFKKMELGEHGLVERLFADGVYAVIAAFPAADVEIMFEQMKMLFCCADDVRDVRRRKVERLKERIDNGNKTDM